MSTDPRWQQVERYLQRRINMDVWEEAPVSRIFNELEAASGLRLLVDWNALATVGVTPSRTATLHARERIASEVFDHFLNPSGLVLVPVGGKTIQVTTHTVAQSRRWLEIYPTAGLSEDGMATVEQLMLRGAAAIDPSSEVAIVVADSNIHKSLSD